MTSDDEVFLADYTSFKRYRVELEYVRQLQLGEEIRDWCIMTSLWLHLALFAQRRFDPIEKVPGLLLMAMEMLSTLGIELPLA